MKRTMSSGPGRGGLAGALLVPLALAVFVVPAAAITWGEKDTTGRYPNVGTILARMSGVVYQWCSGTLIDERVFLTAGHCTVNLPTYLASGLVQEIHVSFDADPFADGTWHAVTSVITHPEFSFTPRSNWHDNGVLILKRSCLRHHARHAPERGIPGPAKGRGRSWERHARDEVHSGRLRSLLDLPTARSVPQRCSAIRDVGVPSPAPGVATDVAAGEDRRRGYLLRRLRRTDFLGGTRRGQDPGRHGDMG